MSEKTTDKSCQICHSYLFDDDDIVVCPICGAPHHRSCYNSLGHCGLEANHGTDLEYDRVKAREDESKTHDSDHCAEVCPSCGRTLNSDGLFCPYCGADRAGNDNGQRQTNMPPYGASFGIPIFDPYGGVDKNDTIDGVAVEDVKSFVAVNTQRYIPKFKKLQKSHKASWNWIAFIVPEAWCFFRKQYILGYIAFVVTLISSLLSLPLTSEMANLIETMPYGSSTYQMMAAMMQNGSSFSQFAITAAFAGGLLTLAKMILFGIFGDWGYRQHTLGKIKKINSDEMIEDKAIALAKAGGTSFLFMLIAFVASEWLPNILMLFIE